MIKPLLYLIILILGFPAGVYLAYLCKDEIKKWRKRLIAISFICFILSALVSLLNFNYKIPFIIGLFFIIISCLTIVWKSHR